MLLYQICCFCVELEFKVNEAEQEAELAAQEAISLRGTGKVTQARAVDVTAKAWQQKATELRKESVSIEDTIEKLKAQCDCLKAEAITLEAQVWRVNKTNHRTAAKAPPPLENKDQFVFVHLHL